MSVNTTAGAWDADVEFVGGADLRDKAELIGIEFKITGVRFEKSARGVEYVYVEAETREGEEFDFNDSSSSGVRAQIITYLERKGTEVDYENPDVVHDVNLLIPNGLRVSTYEVTDLRGKAKTAKTYYLTSGGRRRQQTAA
ncbi:hypothetical protein ABZ208_37460 [Streptomyces sp. NPDC006208]|uniref:hypothetical protein n=1 Tax=Streptomyces sp. NPDC006208 TaxID=3156734 RepID=UPI0033AE0801